MFLFVRGTVHVRIRPSWLLRARNSHAREDGQLNAQSIQQPTATGQFPMVCYPHGNPTSKVAGRTSECESIMKTTKDHDERIANMTFASVYPHYVAKVEKKGRTVEELHQVISWLTGFNEKDLRRLIKQDATFEEFFAEATVNPNASLITGAICGYRVEEIETPLTRQVRYLDKLVDELAKGRKLEKILRTP